jgi:hypothetical protein
MERDSTTNTVRVSVIPFGINNTVFWNIVAAITADVYSKLLD